MMHPLSLSHTGTDCKLTPEPEMIHVAQGRSYRLSGWMKGEDIPKDATCQIRLDFHGASVPVQSWDKAFLEQEMNAYLDFGRRHNVPMFPGEWGAMKQCFENNRGGLEWVNDMLDIIMKNQLHFSFHDYHEKNMGIFYGTDTLPDTANANTALLNLFEQRFGHR